MTVEKEERLVRAHIFNSQELEFLLPYFFPSKEDEMKLCWNMVVVASSFAIRNELVRGTWDDSKFRNSFYWQ